MGRKWGGGETQFPSCIYTPLGAARESRDYYFKARLAIGVDAGNARIALHTTIVKVMIALLTRAGTPAAGVKVSSS